MCRKYRVRRLDVFGSATADNFDLESSDVDLLVEFEEMPPADRADGSLGLLTAIEALLDRHTSVWLRPAQYATLTCVAGLRSPASSSMPRDPRAWLADVVTACDLLGGFTRAKTFSDDAGDAPLRSAVARRFEIVVRAPSTQPRASAACGERPPRRCGGVCPATRRQRSLETARG